MLSEENKKAIEYLTKYIHWETAGERILEIDIKTVLNFITKLQKENKKLKDKNQDLLRKLRNRIKEVKKLTKYSLYKKEFSRLNKIIKEKDKQIDLMADFIYKTGAGRRAFSCTFRKNEECDENGCRSCIKQYFENKVKEEGE